MDKRHFITVLERELNLSYRWEAPTFIVYRWGGCHVLLRILVNDIIEAFACGGRLFNFKANKKMLNINGIGLDVLKDLSTLVRIDKTKNCRFYLTIS